MDDGGGANVRVTIADFCPCVATTTNSTQKLARQKAGLEIRSAVYNLVVALLILVFELDFVDAAALALGPLMTLRPPGLNEELLVRGGAIGSGTENMGKKGQMERRTRTEYKIKLCATAMLRCDIIGRPFPCWSWRVGAQRRENSCREKQQNDIIETS